MKSKREVKMTFAEFVATLDNQHPLFKTFVRMIGNANKWDKIHFHRKGGNLVELVYELIGEDYFPIVDKKMGMVFGVRTFYHEMIPGILYGYHDAYGNPDRVILNSKGDAAAYIHEGHGYYISSMQEELVVSHKYKPDRFDKDLFIFHDPGGLSSFFRNPGALT